MLSEALWPILLTVLLIGVGAGLAFVVMRMIRRWTLHDELGTIFTLQDLREMKARGEITANEYESMRAAVIASVRDADATAPAPDRPAESPETPPGGP